MASGKKSREKRRAQAAAPPPVRSKGMARSRQASPRVLAVAGAVVVAIVVAVVLAIVLTGGGSSTPKGIPKVGAIAGGLPGAPNAAADFQGIPQHGMTLGSPSAKVTLTEYVDLQCPFCREFETQVFPDIVAKYVKTGKVRVVVRVLAFIGADSARGRKAMIAAGEQDRAFNFAEILYFNQGTENTGWLSENMVASAAASIPGLDVAKLLSARNAPSVAATAASFDAQATKDKVSVTPTLLVGRTGGTPSVVPIKSATDEATLVSSLDTALAG